jgi:hypothetical protein
MHGNSAKVIKTYPKSIRIVIAWLVIFNRREKRSVLLFTRLVATGGTRIYRADLMETVEVKSKLAARLTST